MYVHGHLPENIRVCPSFSHPSVCLSLLVHPVPSIVQVHESWPPSSLFLVFSQIIRMVLCNHPTPSYCHLHLPIRGSGMFCFCVCVEMWIYDRMYLHENWITTSAKEGGGKVGRNLVAIVQASIRLGCPCPCPCLL